MDGRTDGWSPDGASTVESAAASESGPAAGRRFGPGFLPFGRLPREAGPGVRACGITLLK